MRATRCKANVQTWIYRAGRKREPAVRRCGNYTRDKSGMCARHRPTAQEDTPNVVSS